MNKLECRSVLICEDEVEIREMIRTEVLRHEPKAIIIEAANGNEGLLRCQNQRFDAVILDMKMPKYDGKHFLEGLTGLLPDFQPRGVIIISGHHDLTGLGAEDTEYFCFPKPFRLREVMTAVMTVFERPVALAKARVTQGRVA